MKLYRLLPTLVASAALFKGAFLSPVHGAAGPDPIAADHVVWTSPSTNSSGSMPLGNGDVGMNLWVEPDGDLLFYLSKSDAWDENARLLKLGRIRVHVSPNPFRTGSPFRQELKLRQAEIAIAAGEAGARWNATVRVDANDPMVRLEMQGEQPFTVRATLEDWRTQERALVDGEESGVDTFAPDFAPVEYPDHVVPGQAAQVVWYHRNERSLWPVTLEHQGLAGFKGQGTDPLLGRTFGGLMRGTGLVSASPTELRSTQPTHHVDLDVFAYTAVADSVSDWGSALGQVTVRAADMNAVDARAAHRAWWNSFWDRSWIRVSAARGEAGGAADAASAAEAATVSQGYALQRFLNGCAGRGAYPIKFNGSIFTVDVPGRYDADYRRWGGCYWFQNTRLAYWPMLAAGDFDLMQPLFKMYRDMLPLAKFRTETYFHHGGAFFPETLHFWGAYHNGDLGYGWKRENEPVGRPVNQYIRYYWSGGLELTALMLDYHSLTQDQTFLHETLLPLSQAILDFYDQHYPREPHTGRMAIVPGQALETWWQCDNPLPEVAGLRFVLRELLALPPGDLAEKQRLQWTRLQASLPDLPKRVQDNLTILAPGESFTNRQNMENPELYAIFPYRLFGVERPDLPLARDTFAKRLFKENTGWTQDPIQMACLGMAEPARAAVIARFRTKDPGSRFPAFWGPNFDWIPDQDHGNVALMALQSMLLQTDGRRILLLPAWPKEWNVDFKLHAPQQTIVEGVYREGKLAHLRVTPTEREKDVVRCDLGQ